MIQINDNGFFEIFPSIKNITQAFEYQNAMLNKIVLTGKINALEIAENLFDFTEKTADTFAVLQKRLIENLLEENKKAIELKAKAKLESILTILVKNLYEMSKNIEVLSQDKTVVDFLSNNIYKKEMMELLNEYKNNYSIYNEVLIIDNEKNVKANINPKNKILRIKDEVIYEVFKNENYLQFHKKTDMFIFQKQSLFFAKRVVNEKNEVIGAVVISFDLEDEMKTIFNKILEKNEIFSIVNRFNDIILSSEVGIDKKFLKSINKFDTGVILNNRFNYKTKLKPYKDYSTNDWNGIISLKSNENLDILLNSDNTNNNIKHLITINIKNEDLKKLTDEAYSILEDLSDVIINGELIAAKSKQYILIPILDNLREVSFKVVKLIEISISSLQKVIDESFVNNAKNISKFIMFNVIKSMYEMVNDIKYWSYNKVFVEELSSKNPNIDIIKDELIRIDNIYLNYYNMFIYDASGKVIVGSKLGEEFEIEDRTILSKTDGYYVSEYKPSKFYEGNSTYIFYSLIKKDNKIIGGVGAVFEIRDFDEMLKSIFNINGFVLVINRKREIISSNISNLEEKKITTELKELELKDGVIKDIEIDDISYKVAVSHFDKYREYKNEDLFTIVAIEK